VPRVPGDLLLGTQKAGEEEGCMPAEPAQQLCRAGESRMLVIPPQTPKPPFFNKRREKPWGAGVRRFPRDFLRVRVSLMTTSAGDYLHSYIYVLHAGFMTDCLWLHFAVAVEEGLLLF